MSDAPQRAALNRLATALNCSPSALRRDDCGDPAIVGKRGHVYTVPEGWQLFVTGWTARGWTSAKAALNFATICNDGDDEGGIHPRPTAERIGSRRYP